MRRHWPVLALLVPAIAVRVLVSLAVHPAWWILGDSIGYLNVALSHQPERWRPGGYGVLVLLPLRPLHQLALVTILQHVIGLAAGLLVYATLLRLRLPAWAAALAAAPAMLDGYVVASEQTLASEPLFGFLVIAGLALLVWRAGRATYVEVAAAGLLLGLAATTRIVGLPLVGVAVLALLLWRAGWLRPAVLSAAFALPLVVYASWFSHAYGAYELTASSGVFLYGRTTNFVDCGRIQFTDPALRRLCPTEPVGARNELWYVFATNSPVQTTGLGVAATDDLASRFAMAAIRSQPGDFAALGWSGLASTFAWGTGTQFVDLLLGTDLQLPADGRAAGLAYQHGADPGPFTDPVLVHVMRDYEGVASVPGTMCLLALLLAVAALLVGRDRDGRGLRPALVLASGVATVLLVVPAVTSIAGPRYRVPAIPALCLVVAISGSLLLSRWRAHAPAAGASPAERSGPAAGSRPTRRPRSRAASRP